MGEKLKLYGFNNLTKALSFNIYDVCYAKTAREQKDYISYVDEQYSSQRLTKILTTLTEMIGAKVLNIAQQDYEPQGASVTLLIAEGSMMPAGHWASSDAHTDAYLAVAPTHARVYARLRDQYVPGGQMWVTESGDAGGGGDTWASTYLDVFRTLHELGSFAAITDGVIFHNTLASSDYGFLRHGTFEPRPNYFAVQLWNQLMGQTVYDTAQPDRESLHVFAHSRRDGAAGMAYLVINNSLTETVEMELPVAAQRYTLSAGSPRASVMMLNGRDLVSDADGNLPEMLPAAQAAGRVAVAPMTCTFFILDSAR